MGDKKALVPRLRLIMRVVRGHATPCPADINVDMR